MQLYNYIVPSLNTPLTSGHIPANDLLAKIKQHRGEGYHSLFNMEKRETYVSYQGAISIPLGWFPLDFDSEDLERAKADVLTCWQALGLDASYARIYFSGRKGFHLYLRQELFLDSTSVLAIRTSIINWKSSYSLETLDVSIIQASRKFRLPNSKHNKTPYYKVEIDVDQLQAWSIDQIKAFAAHPREITLETYAIPKPYTFSPATTQTGIDQYTSHGTTSRPVYESNGPGVFGVENIISDDPQPTFKDKVCIKRMWDATLPVGERHATILALINDSYETGESVDSTRVKLATFAARNGIMERWEADILRALNERYSGKRTHSYGCYSPTKGKHCSGTCPLYPRLTNKELRPKVNDITPEIAKLVEKTDKQVAKASETKQEVAKAQATAFVKGLPDWKNKQPLCTIENVRHMMSQLGIQANYDMIKKDIKIHIPDSVYLIDTEKNDKLTRIVSYATKCGMPHGQVAEYVAFVADQAPINPVARWIESIPWDGISRVQEFYDTVKITQEADPHKKALKETLLKRWMVSGIAAAFLPNGVSAHGVLVFAGKQYIGKTNWFKNLVPQALDVTRDGMLLDIKDKDSVYQIVSNWIVELGEVDATFRKSDIAQLKAFLTRAVDTIRLPYRREAASFARRTIFFASVNDSNYLADPTGNRRFWTVDCEAINHTHNLDMQQVWAEFHTLFKAGEAFHLTHEEMLALNASNLDHENENPYEERLLDKFEFDGQLCFITLTDVAVELGYDKPSGRDLKMIGAAVRKVTGQIRVSNNERKGFWLRKKVPK